MSHYRGDAPQCVRQNDSVIKTMTKGTRTKRSIALAAASIFNVSGYAGTSIADILKATKLEKGGLYRHFASKDEIAIAAFDCAVKALERRHSLGQHGRESAIDRLMGSIDVVVSFIYKPPLPGGCPILNTAIDANGTHEALRLRAAKAFRDWQRRLVRVVDDGIASGELRPGIEAVAVASILTSALEGALMATMLLDDSAQMYRTEKHLREFVSRMSRGRVRSFRSIGYALENTKQQSAASPR